MAGGLGWESRPVQTPFPWVVRFEIEQPFWSEADSLTTVHGWGDYLSTGKYSVACLLARRDGAQDVGPDSFRWRRFDRLIISHSIGTRTLDGAVVSIVQ